MSREPSVFPVEPAKVYPSDHKPGIPGGHRMSTPDTETPSARDVIVQTVDAVDELLTVWVPDAVLKALSDAGYTVARLDRLDCVWESADLETIHGPDPGPGDHPVYRIVGDSE